MDITEIKSLAAAYEAALEHDYCPSPDEAASLVDDIDTNFLETHFRQGAEKNQGRRPDEIARSLVFAISKLDDSPR